MQLSPHFSLEEFQRSETGARKGLDNTCPAPLLPRLKNTAERMEQVRSILGNVPITVFSGYRSPAVNRAVGGANSSAHTLGYAVDFMAKGLSISRTVEMLRHSILAYDQIIDEFGAWVHVSFDPRFRRQILSARKVDKKTQYSFI